MGETIYKEDVYVVTPESDDKDLIWNDHVRAAHEKGYNYIADYDNVPMRYHPTRIWEVYLLPATEIVTYRATEEVIMYDDLPSKVTIESKVLEFLQDPARSNPNLVYRKLANSDFFGNTTDNQITILRELISDTTFCTEGRRKFTEFMGDLLAEPDPYAHLPIRQSITLAMPYKAPDDKAKAVIELINTKLADTGLRSRVIMEDK